MLDATYEVGLGPISPARPVHDLRGHDPRRVQGAGRPSGDPLRRPPTPFGDALLLATERGIAGLSFLDDGPDEALEEARAAWLLSRLVEDQDGTAALVAPLFAGDGVARGRASSSRAPTSRSRSGRPCCACRPAAWCPISTSRARSVSRGRCARSARRWRASPLGYLVPCHQVIRATGALGDYRWGRVRRRALLAWEAAQAEAAGA